MHAKVTEKLSGFADQYVEEVLGDLRNGDVADPAIAYSFLMIAADVVGLTREVKATALVRRQHFSACAPPSDNAVVLDI